MAKADVEKLIQYSKEHDSKESDMGMDYDTGHSSMVYSRGEHPFGKRNLFEITSCQQIKTLFS